MNALNEANLTWNDIDAVIVGKAPDMFEGVIMPEIYLTDDEHRRMVYMLSRVKWLPPKSRPQETGNRRYPFFVLVSRISESLSCQPEFTIQTA